MVRSHFHVYLYVGTILFYAAGVTFSYDYTQVENGNVVIGMLDARRLPTGRTVSLPEIPIYGAYLIVIVYFCLVVVCLIVALFDEFGAKVKSNHNLLQDLFQLPKQTG